MGPSTSDPIIIVGAGSLGLSAALHLAQRGYTDVSVFGKNDDVPPGDLSIVVYRTAQDAGVQFFPGQQVDEIVYVSTLTGRKNAGIRTQDGQFYSSVLVIIEAGAGDSHPMSQVDPMHDPLATPLSWYTNLSHSLVNYVPQDSSVILLSSSCKCSGQGSSLFSLVGSMVLDLLGATSDQPIAVKTKELSDILPQNLARL
ncbi:hypothetical protein N7508_004770 [Penicillium antarcticum]|uniref:uncharacterized protein n=1 Tax=Penicillium antarcticum TaxID=416450 RepID=UPI0023896569|nr:uncharacterized protein N7508_004770 [Penicillium antarcticum]KAJ5305755.1 hypothetical protein N7508_004770 [Penicillium antarcticum]